VLIRRRDVRLRERRIGPYKYPTIDKEMDGKINPKTETRTEKTKAEKTEHKSKNKYTEKERKAEDSHRSALPLSSSLQKKKKERH
jgi:hypothetical protein